MKTNFMKKTIKILVVLILILSISVFVLSIGAQISGIYINTSPSLPVGFYKIVDEPIANGAYVAFCPPPNAVFDMAMDRSYINQGNCPGRYGLLLKREHIPKSAQLTTDAEDHALPQYRLDQRVLDDFEYLLLSDVNPQSFDARYFGLIARDQIQQVVRPIFTWSH